MSSDKAIALTTKEDLRLLYSRDFYEWVIENLKLIENKEYELVDWENLLLEIQDMGQRHLDAAISHMGIILEHIYKWEYFKEDENMGNGWIKSMLNSRNEISYLFQRQPSLKNKVQLYIEDAWEYAITRLINFFKDPENSRLAQKYFGKIPNRNDFPQKCPYTFEQILNFEPFL